MATGIMCTIKNALTVRKYAAIQQLPPQLLSEFMGCDRGTPIDRYYIEHFLECNRRFITGDVMEIAENTYTMRYGTNISHSYIFTNDSTDRRNDVIIGDLTSGEGCIPDSIDCFILTQTLPFIFDVQSVVKNIVKMLRPKGVALITVRGISMISRYDEVRWGDYWGFTKQSLYKCFERVVSSSNIEIFSYGNAKTAAAFLFGMCQEDLEKSDFDSQDPLVPVILAATVRKD